MHFKLFKFFIFLFPLLSLAQLDKLPEEWKKDKDLKNASIGFCVMNAATFELISEYNSHQLQIPASTLKSCDHLGSPEFTWLELPL